ncbi:nicotinate-nucleotide adenylyltransferase [Halomonas sp. GFAJ-1]|uniref:nicotinate-nucleotide adenylyltransferase n=1 Tax=Halomonas sp. GFAJ-1 TaxID=1118153 RepID=UPI00023A3821|nr:nicotinate-nucleotide adenylyltransferase [Halomonas sp. GFAJ-1]AVI63727.1 nicotinate-nicotinamide nucleotide adenylyltransferase [Halomonas sp. GFAJ-1]EHK62180.1 nicotinic acid mononucleotide adenyltransferase [Halomonas sp. GFAJ-1]
MSHALLKVGMLGGTFDPVHLGHLRSAVEVREALGLDRLHMIPAPKPPLRDAPQVSPDQRFELLKMGIADTPGIIADGRELRREGPSYSVDTLAELRSEYGSEVPLTMIIGFDAFLRLTKWHKVDEIFTLAHLVVIARPGYQTPWPPALKELVGNREVDSIPALMQRPCGSMLSLTLPSMMAISATYVRERLKAGESVRYLLPEAVERSILQQGLYQTYE